MDVKKLILKLFNSQKLTVVSSINKKGNPESATVGFGHTKDLKIIFGTDMTTRKAQNIADNNHVSMVINGPDSSVQYEGIAKLVSGDPLKPYFKVFFKKVPGLKKYSLLTNQIYFVVTPKWIRYIDHTTSPGTVNELKF